MFILHIENSMHPYLLFDNKEKLYNFTSQLLEKEMEENICYDKTVVNIPKKKINFNFDKWWKAEKY